MANEKFNIFMISIRESKNLQTYKKHVSEESWISSQSIRLKNMFATIKFLFTFQLYIEPPKNDFNYGNYRVI